MSCRESAQSVVKNSKKIMRILQWTSCEFQDFEKEWRITLDVDWNLMFFKWKTVYTSFRCRIFFVPTLDSHHPKECHMSEDSCALEATQLRAVKSAQDVRRVGLPGVWEPKWSCLYSDKKYTFIYIYMYRYAPERTFLYVHIFTYTNIQIYTLRSIEVVFVLSGFVLRNCARLISKTTAQSSQSQSIQVTFTKKHPTANPPMFLLTL